MLKTNNIKIYNSTEHIEEPKIGDLKLKVNSIWDFCSRDVCFQKTEKTIGNGYILIGYDLEECIEVSDGIIIGGTEKVKNTKWKRAEINEDIIKQLKDDGYTISNDFKKLC
jgi:hypothetical protein